MDGVEIQIEGLDQALAVLNHFANPGLMQEGLPILGAVLESQTKARFPLGVDPDGRAWAPWSEAYKASGRTGKGILWKSGALQDSIAWQMVGDELRVGSNLVYAAVHQFGSAEKPHTVKAHERTNLFGRKVAPFQVGPYERQGNIPARPYAGVSPADAAEAEDALIAWLAETVPGGHA